MLNLILLGAIIVGYILPWLRPQLKQWPDLAEWWPVMCATIVAPVLTIVVTLAVPRVPGPPGSDPWWFLAGLVVLLVLYSWAVVILKIVRYNTRPKPESSHDKFEAYPSL